MKYLLLVFLIVGVSCSKPHKKKFSNVRDKVVKQDSIPNIYVVKTIFYSKDSLLITADIYEVNDKKPTVLLCHQAGYSRGEYIETAKKINYLGFSCVAIDQRSGNKVNGIINETAKKATESKLATNYMSAKIDIEAAIDYVYKLNGGKPIILVGSSYSASLALLIGNTNSKIKAIAAFSPREYLEGVNLKDEIKNMSKPIFVTSSKKEILQVEQLVSLINNKFVMHYKPKVKGIHGSKSLWESSNGNEFYWIEFKKFLQKNKPTKI
ncbi:hypothetical protein R3X25_14775 [Lutibacter sp. TH_r2]|uniref:hypothetical protein n=1 Tax=Lutibacter sp. TH_r2 TaxID=3082083 RepID=UPI002952DC6B|nr:hypothetical protein [Lutibacter sp. TH_r2]MDV7188550.1 hypothetical protein [Lutibacter sp. TH_r2]